MRTITCVLKFLDGKTATASLSAAMASDLVEVHYSGAVDRLIHREHKMTLSLLLLACSQSAKETGAELKTTFEGLYDYAE